MLTALFLFLGQTDPLAAEALEEIPLTLRVNHAISLGVEHLKSLQDPDGSYPGYGNHGGGATALVTYTLVKSGVRRTDPAVMKAVAWLARQPIRSTYSASVHLLMCEALRDPGVLSIAERSLEFLLEHQEQGVWAYPWNRVDNSNTQFALLGLRAATRMGLEVDEEVWLEALEGLYMFHHPSGAFGYMPEKRRPYMAITAGGLSSLAVIEEASRDHPRLKKAVRRAEGMREEAVAWMEENFDLTRNRYWDGTWEPTSYRGMWAVERWCGLTGRERFAGRDWYVEGAEFLIADQALDGTWNTKGVLEDTCFALLFLRRATVSGGDEVTALDAHIEELRRERLAAHPKLPGPDATRLTEWWLAGPWLDRSSRVMLLEPPFDPGDARPGGRGRIDRREWELVSLSPRSWTDLDEVAEGGGESRLWLLSTWLCVGGDEPVDVILWLEVQDGWGLWVRGEHVASERLRGGRLDGGISFRLRLEPGENQVTVLVEDMVEEAAFGALLTDAANGPAPARVVVCTDPKAWKRDDDGRGSR